MSAVSEERVLRVHHWNDSLFSFTTTRNPGLRFRNGHFVMIGLEVEGRPLLRAFSFANANYDDHLEFYSIKVPNGPLTSRLQHIRPGDPILVGRKPTGTLILDHLRPGKRLYLLGSGTGLAPFMSLVRDPDVYERFDVVVLAHGVRHVSDLGYRGYIEDELPNHELVGDDVRRKLRYYPSVTREAFRNRGRLTDRLATDELPADLGLPPLDAAHDRVMICGSPAMLADTVALLEARGFEEGSSDGQGHYVIEKAFVQR
jgi:ferredoxin--NADP+ reductase